MKRPPITHQSTKLAELRADLARRTAALSTTEGLQPTAVPGLGLFRRSAPSACTSATYEPSLIVFLQGKKRINLGRATYLCDHTTFLLTSIDLPVVSQVIAATKESPNLGLSISLSMPEVRSLLNSDELPATQQPTGTQGMAVGKTTIELLDACSRLIDLLDTPEDIPFLSTLIQREIIYRLLRSPQGAHLRAIATLGEQSQRTAKAVAWLRTNFARPLRIEDLASMAQMGVSTLHHHFRSLTAMSPLQYQKHLRLHTARERMLNEGLDASSAAFEVGYESPSQFSREYSRFFGQPPMRDIKARLAVAASTGTPDLTI